MPESFNLSSETAVWYEMFLNAFYVVQFALLFLTGEVLQCKCSLTSNDALQLSRKSS